MYANLLVCLLHILIYVHYYYTILLYVYYLYRYTTGPAIYTEAGERQAQATGY